MPYEGQHEPKELSSVNTTVEKTLVEEAKEMVSMVQPERKVVTQPSGKLLSANIGIKSTLNPPKKKGLDDEEDLPESHEAYTEEDLKKFWNNYAYELKSANRDSLFTTLTRSEMTVNSDHLITLKIKNHQASELESEKLKLLRFLRFNLKNTRINLEYQIEKAEVKSVLDSKSTFEKLAEENGSLHKFRKMFNLDIEF